MSKNLDDVMNVSRAAVDSAVLQSKDVIDNTLFEKVSIDKIFSDVYCRPLRPKRVSDIKEAWDADAVGVLLVSYRDDIDMYACVDGNHRVAVARALGISHLPCRVYVDKTLQDEAALYAKFGNVSKQNPIDKFRARLVMKDPQALAIERIVLKYSLEIPLTGPAGPRTGTIRAVAELDRIYGAHGADALEWIIATTFRVWAGDQLAYTTWALQGMTAFWMRHHNQLVFKYPHFVKRLQQTGIRALQQKAVMMRAAMSTAQGIRNAWGRAMWEIYNYRLPEGSRLPEWTDTFATEHGKKKSADAAAKANKERARKAREKKAGH